MSKTAARARARTDNGPGSLRIEHVDLATLKRWPRNPKDHDLPAIRESFARFGFVAPVVLDEGTGRIVSGHGRVDALAALQAQGGAPPARVQVVAGPKGKRWLIPVLRGVRFGTEREAEAYLLADNQLTILGGWREPELAPLLKGLLDAGELAGTGFEARDLDDLFRRLQEAEDPGGGREDPGAHLGRAAELQRKWGTAAGQVWTAGPHRLACGDATDPQLWTRLMAGRRAACVFTDPPYGVNYLSPSGKFKALAGDELKDDAFIQLLAKAFARLAAHAEEEAAWYVWHASATRDEFLYALKAAGIREIEYLIWAKPAALTGTMDYRYAHEPCFYAAKAGRRPRFYGGATQETVWRVAHRAAGPVSAVIGPGIAVWDGAGHGIYVAQRFPKGRKLRQLRIGPGEPAYLHPEGAEQDVWEVAREAQPDHPTQKPVELARRAIRNSSQAGEVVVDGFLGSGSTLVGAALEGRHGYGLELDPGYVAVALERLAGLGLTPEQEEA